MEKKFFPTYASEYRLFNSLLFCSYAVLQVSEIQRFNNLFSNDSIHLCTELKIPYCSSMNSTPSSSPRSTRKATDGPIKKTGESSENDSSYEEEVKQKPLSVLENRNKGLTSSGEKDIKCLLDTVDMQLQKSRDFAEKLAQKKWGTLLFGCSVLSVCLGKLCLYVTWSL